MRRDLNTFTKRGFRHAVTWTALVLPFLFAGLVHAAKVGHGRVTSAPGQPLQISLPLLELNPQDLSVLQVKVLDESRWSKAGLTPPVPLDSLTVVLKPGQTSASSEVVISSTQQTKQSPVDILLEVTTATGSTQVQSSYLILLPAPTNSAGKSSSASSLRVSPGDTLFGIAQRHLVNGSDMYQMLQAIFEANPNAFIAGNMNLLRAGAVLNIPDANAIRAIDKYVARSTYQKHLAAFNQRRLGTYGRNTPLVAGKSTQSGVVSAAPAQEAPVDKTDRVKLSTPNSADQSADAKVSAAKEIDELQSRIQALQQNVKQLKESLGDVTTESSATASSPLVGQASSVGASAKSTMNEAASNPTSNTSKNSGLQDAQDSSTNAWSDLSEFLSNNILAVLTALIALSALVIAWMLRRAGIRKDEDGEELDAVMHANPAVQSAFDKKLQSINLELDSDSEPSNQTTPPVRQSL